jgi:hypothetical protein
MGILVSASQILKTKHDHSNDISRNWQTRMQYCARHELCSEVNISLTSSLNKSFSNLTDSIYCYWRLNNTLSEKIGIIVSRENVSHLLAPPKTVDFYGISIQT